jgi:hypothetical protein
MHADNFAAQILRWLAWNAWMRGDGQGAKAYASQAVQVVRKVGMTFIGPSVLAVEAALTEDEAVSQALLTEAEGILDAGCVAHNHFWFAQTAIRHALVTSAWDRVERYAARLEVYTQWEPLPWSDYLVARGRSLAAWGRGERGAACTAELQRLKSIAEERHLRLDQAELSSVLAVA